MKTKSIQIRVTIYCFILIIFTSCGKWDFTLGNVYYFTKKDLSFLYINKDTLTPKERNINYYDTVYFLLNSKDKCMAEIYTNISPDYDYAGFEERFRGDSWLEFHNTIHIKTSQVSVEKEHSNVEAKKYFTVFYYKWQNYYYTLDSIKESTIKLDTALILKHLYSEVIKLYPSIEDSTSKFKSIYFAKNIGFIKIETIDGEKLELINDPK
jgi:hypothetical protein